MNYFVNDKGYNSYMEAMRYAQSINATVIDSDGIERWKPATPVDSKKMRLYKHRLAAYEAQKRMDESN